MRKKLIKKYQLGSQIRNLGSLSLNTQIPVIPKGGLQLPQSTIDTVNKQLSSPTKKSSNWVTSAGIDAATGIFTDKLTKELGDSDFGRILGNTFSSGFSSAGNTVANNILKGEALTSGLMQNTGASLAGTGAGIAANYLGQGITSAMGDSRLGRAVGAGTATGLGTVGGAALANLAKTGQWTTNLGKLNISPTGLGLSVVGSALGAATGPSKEYGGKYGNITQTADTIYDGLTLAANALPGGQIFSGALALNKGLSNIFGSTDGMTVQDSILGSAFMLAPVKWLNMWGAKTTGTFNNQSWQNSQRTTNFMGNAFGNLQQKFDQAREEAGKTYGTFSRSAYHDAQDNIDFANLAWDKVLAMTNQNEYQNIRAQDMSSINNQRYAQMIQGGWSPIYRGKMGMKILNNSINHNLGMRLLSGAALIDNKQMILSAGNGVKIPKFQTPAGPIEKSDNTRVQKSIVVKPIRRKLKPGEFFYTDKRTGKTYVGQTKDAQVSQDNRTEKQRHSDQRYAQQKRKQIELEQAEEQTAQVANAVLERTMPSYWVEQATGEDLGTVGRLGVDLISPYVLGKGISLLGKTSQGLNKLAILPKQSELFAPEIPIKVSNYTGRWRNWVERIQPKLTNKNYDSQKLLSIGNASKDKAFQYYKSDEFVKRAKNAGFNDSEIFQLQNELQDMLNHSQIKSSNSTNNGIHAWADAYLDNSGNLYRNVTSFEPHVQGFSLEDIIGMWDHEFGHVATNMYNSAGRNLGNFMQQVESRYPMIVKMMKYNESIAPKFKAEIENLYNFWHSPNIELKLKQSYPELSAPELNEFINKYQKFSENIKEYIGNSNELRSRALSTQFAAQRKGKSAYQYIQENSEDLNAARELDNIFENKSLKKYLDNFLNYSVPITTVGGASYVSTKQ